MNSVTTKDLVRLLLRNLIVILLVAVICGAGTFIYCRNFAEEKYKATGSILVTTNSITIDENGRVDNTQVAASINLLSTIKDLLNKPGIYETVAKQFDGKYSVTQLMNAVKVSSTDDKTLVVNISFTLGSKAEAVEVTNAFLNATPDYMTKYIEASRTMITSTAMGATKTAPRTVVMTAIFAALGAVITYAIYFIIFVLNLTIRTEEEFSAIYDIPVLGNIPDFAGSSGGKKSSSKKK